MGLVEDLKSSKTRRIKSKNLQNRWLKLLKVEPSLLKSAKILFVQDLQMSLPSSDDFYGAAFTKTRLIDCVRTDKGMRKITEDHTYYEFKYLRRQTFMDLHGRPDLFLKMLKS